MAGAEILMATEQLSLTDLLAIMEEIENYHSQRAMKRWSAAVRQAINRMSAPLVPPISAENKNKENEK
jgi:hypothetical protein